MTANKHYQEFIRAKIQGAIAEANAASMLTHQGVKGTVLEILISRLFRPLLPSDLGIGTGQVIDQNGNISNQVDIIMYDRSILPPALYDDQTGLFPIEAVLYTIEVKTTLTRKGLEQAHTAAKKISEFGYQVPGKSADGAQSELRLQKARSVIFALSSDAKNGEADRYQRVCTSKKELPYLAAICVAGKEYIYSDAASWIVQKATGPYDEILTFLGGVMNTYKDVAQSRRHAKLGYYIIPTVSVQRWPPDAHYGPVRVICKVCGLSAEMPLNIQKTDETTVNGVIPLTDPPCGACGGALEAPPAQYKFNRGVLISLSALHTAESTGPLPE